MDQEFAYEQEHLSNAHAKLTQIYERLNQELEREKAAFEKAVADRLDDVTFNFSSDDDVMETLADLEANNLIIDSYGDARTATKDELIDYAMRSGAPMEVVENLQEIEDEGEPYDSIEDLWPDYPTKEDFFFNEDEY